MGLKLLQNESQLKIILIINIIFIRWVASGYSTIYTYFF